MDDGTQDITDLEPQSWDRKEGEPDLWWIRFCRFKALGNRRSILALFNAERAKEGQEKSNQPPGSWRDAAKTWDWRARAAAFDSYEQQQEVQALEDDRKKAREKRQIILDASLAKLAEAIQHLDARKINWYTFPSALRAILELNRLEMGELVPTRLEHSGPGGGPVTLATLMERAAQKIDELKDQEAQDAGPKNPGG